MNKTLTDAERATIMDACQSISRSADALKECHTVDGDWGDDVDAKAFYDAELRLLERLTALLATQQPEPREEVTEQFTMTVEDAMRIVMANWGDKDAIEKVFRANLTAARAGGAS